MLRAKWAAVVLKHRLPRRAARAERDRIPDAPRPRREGDALVLVDRMPKWKTRAGTGRRAGKAGCLRLRVGR